MTTARETGPTANAAAHFQPTRWSRVLAAAQRDSEALEEFCRSYWYPVYGHLRRRGLSPEDAADCTQLVFGRLAQPEALNGVTADRGRFRSFLLACADHEASRWRAGETTQKRGGDVLRFSIDELQGEERFGREGFNETEPSLAYDRAFAVAVVGEALDLLRREYQRLGQTELFTSLCPLLTDPPDHGELAALAERLDLTEGNLRLRWHRLRRRFAGLLLEVLTQTVTRPEEARAELHHLLRVFANAPGTPSVAVERV